VPPDGLLSYPVNRVIAQFDAADDTCAAIAELERAAFDADEVFALVGPEGEERLDVSGRHHGLAGRVYRFAEGLGDEHGDLLAVAAHLRAGGIKLFVPAEDEARASDAARILGAIAALGTVVLKVVP
jgi:hypothetical protein